MFATTALRLGFRLIRYPCARKLPLPYTLFHWSPSAALVNTHSRVTVDSHEQPLGVRPLRQAGWRHFKRLPIFELGPDGKTMKKGGAGLFSFRRIAAV